MYRDADGRVRREEDRASGSPSISITDPVTETSITLDPDTRTARETPVLGVPSFQYFLGALEQIEGRYLLQEPFRLLSARPGSGAGSGTGSGAGSGSGGGGRGGAASGTVGGARGGGGAGGARGGVTRRDESVTEQLPARSIEGVQCTGVRRPTTIAAGAIGNELPIKIVSEEWTSTDLQVLVLTDFNDPRTGRSTYQLQKINRAAPDAALFRVPADYTIQRAGGGRGRGGDR